MSDRREEVASSLHQWASREMHFTPQGRYVNAPMPSPQDFKGICRGNLLSIWNHVLTHVHSTQNVHKVKANLALKSQLNKSSAYRVRYQGDAKYSAEREALIKRRRDLVAKVTGVKSDISHLDQFLQNLEKEILSAEGQYQASCDAVSNIHQKRALLSQYASDCQADAARYNEYQKRLGARLQQYQSLDSCEGDRRYFSRLGAGRGQRTDSPTLETACTKSVRDACGDVTSFLNHLLEGGFNNNQQAVQTSKDRIWTEIEKLMADNSPQDVLHSLATITMETTQDLKQTTANINIAKEADDLRFKYKAGSTFQDLSPGSTQPQSVHQMIEKKHVSHLTTFMDAERSRNRAWRLDQHLSQLAAAVQAKMAAMFTNDPGALDLARRLFSTELEMASSAAALMCLRSLKNELSENVVTEGREKEALYAKYQKIQDFRGLSDQKQDLIRVLARQNLDAKKKLEDKRRELGRYMETKLCSHETGTITMTTKLKDRVNREVENFASLPLHLLRVTSLDSGEAVPVSHLSINRLADQSPSAGGGALLEVLRALRCPLYKAPECALAHLTELRVEMASIQGLLDSQHVLGYYGNNEEAGHDIIKHIQGLCEEVAANDDEQTKRLLPVLQKRLAESSSATNHCLKAREHVTAWWEQPAEQLTPWVRVEGQTLQQWLDKWAITATQLRQMDK